jgi:hypothetical protein
VHRYRAGEAWWPDRKFERETIRPVQDSRFEVDAWEGPISDYLSGIKNKHGDKARTTVIEIATDKLGFEALARLGSRDQQRITAILRRLGWQPERTKRSRYWAPVPKQPELELKPEGDAG